MGLDLSFQSQKEWRFLTSFRAKSAMANKPLPFNYIPVLGFQGDYLFMLIWYPDMAFGFIRDVT